MNLRDVFLENGTASLSVRTLLSMRRSRGQAGAVHAVHEAFNTEVGHEAWMPHEALRLTGLDRGGTTVATTAVVQSPRLLR